MVTMPKGITKWGTPNVGNLNMPSMGTGSSLSDMGSATVSKALNLPKLQKDISMENLKKGLSNAGDWVTDRLSPPTPPKPQVQGVEQATQGISDFGKALQQMQQQPGSTIQPPPQLQQPFVPAAAPQINVPTPQAIQPTPFAAPTITATTPVAQQMNLADQADIRGSQQQLLQQLQQQAAGTATTPAQIQQQKAFEQALASQYAAAASQPLQAGTLRNMQRNVADLQQKAAVESGLLRLQEQQAAQEALGTQLGQVRQADIGVATTQAQLAQQTELARAQMEQERKLAEAGFGQQIGLKGMEQQFEGQQTAQQLGQQLGIAQAGLDMEALKLGQAGQQFGQNLALEYGKLGQQGGQFQQQMQADLLKTALDAELRKLGITTTADTEAYKSKQQGLGGLLGAGASALATYFASDANEKQDIERTDPKELDAFFKALVPTDYKYKNPDKHGPGRYTGFLAQEIHPTKIGQEVVKEIDGVKMIDNQKLLFAMAAQIGNLTKKNKRG